jgi:fermentation-respiration switch protein FrsA (DUF1100 family)
MQRSDVTFTSAGTPCAAWLYLPEGQKNRAPCVILAHGLSGVREQRLDAYAERFAQAGLAALVFDYRHFGGSDGEPRQLLDVGLQLTDWQAAIAYARALDCIDPERIAIWGTSFSGGHVMATAARDDQLAAAVSQNPFADGLAEMPGARARDGLRTTFEGVRDRLGARRGRPPRMISVVGAPGSRAAIPVEGAVEGMRGITPPGSTWRNEIAARIGPGILRYRPGRRAAAIRCPILFCVCDRDLVVPVKPVLKAAQAAHRGELKRYPLGHFGIYIGEGFERAVADQTEFLTRHLLEQPVTALN